MKLRTEIQYPKYDFKLNYNSKVITIGSCFSEVIGDYLKDSKFSVMSNPFGTVYNIKSISTLLINALNKKELRQDWLVTREGSTFHYGYHSDFFGQDSEAFTQEINSVSAQVKDYLTDANLLIITLGTSWVYEYKEEVVSNCHKQPASNFTKRLLMLDEQVAMHRELLATLLKVNPQLKVLLTVSPVRHIKDGIAENSVSKSILRVLCEIMCNESTQIYYFPSYEILIDDLRDYRFYKSDLIHPTAQAEDYIKDIFSECLISVETNKIKDAWSKIRTALNHKPFNADSESHQSFLVNLLAKIESFKEHFDVSEEISQLKARTNQV